MKRALTLLSGMVVLVLLVAACGGGDDEPASTSTPRPTSAAAATATGVAPTATRPAPAAGVGTIAGVVSFDGTPPEAETLEIDKDIEVCGTSKTNEELLVSSGGGIQNAVVSIKGITGGKAMTFPATAQLDQKDCVYGPHVLMGRVDGSVEVNNGDPLMHNVHSFPFDNDSVNRAQPQGSDPIVTPLSFAEIYKVGCDIHSWMNAWVVAAEHAYYETTGEDGAFSLTDVPAGTYEVEVWHETLGKLTQTVTVTADATTDISFALAPR